MMQGCRNTVVATDHHFSEVVLANYLVQQVYREQLKLLSTWQLLGTPVHLSCIATAPRQLFFNNPGRLCRPSF